MIPTAANKIRQVALVPFVEVEVIAILDLPFRHPPLIECLVHHKKPHAVAQVEELRCKWIVAGANRIASHRAQLRESPLPHPLRYRCSQTTGFRVDAKTASRIPTGVSHKSTTWSPSLTVLRTVYKYGCSTDHSVGFATVRS